MKKIVLKIPKTEIVFKPRHILKASKPHKDKKKYTRKVKMFSVTASDCRFIAKRGSGKGGQKRNKTSNAIQCFHDPSGAMGESEDGREQSLNKRKAFERMVNSKEFQSWLILKIETGLGNIEIEEISEMGNKYTRKLEIDEV